MNTLHSLKCAAVLLPALAMGIPMAYANDEERNDPRNPERSASATGQHYLETMPTRGYDSDSLVGQEVKSRRNNESVGTISKLLIDENDKIVAAVISVGGLLGIGERDVAVSWDQIERRVDGDETTLWVNLTEDSLKDAPKFSSETTYSGTDQQRTGQHADQRTGQHADQRTGQQAGQRTGQQAEQRTGQQADQRAASGRTAQYLETMPDRGYHSDSLVGQEVKSRNNNETIGTVSNLLLDHDGQVVAVVVGVGGLLGIGERDVAIAWDQVERTFDGDDVTLWVELTEQHLKDAPKYESGKMRSRSRR